MKFLSLFAGVGGFDLGLERAGMNCVAQCEIDDKCNQVLAKHWPNVKRYTDVRTLTGEKLEQDGITDIGLICGGFPCQPFSVAGKREGAADDRHLWPEYFRLIKEIRPDYVLGENVAGLINMGLDSVLADLESENYACQTFVIPACAVDAPHRRDRVWIVAYTECRPGRSSGHGQDIQQADNTVRRPHSNVAENTSIRSEALADTDTKRQSQQKGIKQELRRRFSDRGEVVADSAAEQSGTVHKRAITEKGGEDRLPRESGGSGCIINCESMADTRNARREVGLPESRQRDERISEIPIDFSDRRGRRPGPGEWPTEPPVGRVANGIPGRVDRLKQLGNAVVPQIPEIIGRAILESM